MCELAKTKQPSFEDHSNPEELSSHPNLDPSDTEFEDHPGDDVDMEGFDDETLHHSGGMNSPLADDDGVDDVDITDDDVLKKYEEMLSNIKFPEDLKKLEDELSSSDILKHIEEHENFAATHRHYVTDPEQKKKLLAAARNRTEAFTVEELQDHIQSAVEFLTDVTLSKGLFGDQTEDIIDAWLSLVPTNLTKVRDRTLRMLDFIRKTYGKDIVQRLETELKHSIEGNSTVLGAIVATEVLSHYHRVKALNLDFNETMLTDIWKNGIAPVWKKFEVRDKENKKTVDANSADFDPIGFDPSKKNYTYADAIESVFRWNVLGDPTKDKAPDDFTFETAVNLMYNMERSGFEFPGVDMKTLLKWYPRFKPFKTMQQLNNSFDKFEPQVYLAASIMEVITDKGARPIKKGSAPEEEKFLRHALVECVAANHSDLVGFIAQALQNMQYDDSDADVRLAKNHLLQSQNPSDGSFGQQNRMFPPIRETWIVLAGIMPRGSHVALPHDLKDKIAAANKGEDSKPTVEETGSVWLVPDSMAIDASQNRISTPKEFESLQALLGLGKHLKEPATPDPELANREPYPDPIHTQQQFFGDEDHGLPDEDLSDETISEEEIKKIEADYGDDVPPAYDHDEL